MRRKIQQSAVAVQMHACQHRWRTYPCAHRWLAASGKATTTTTTTSPAISPVSMQRLPEELLREILVYVFHLSPESFCGSRTRWHSLARPLGHYQKRGTCQDLLLVCKLWLRVATPLLYESLAVRTPAHAATVTTLLKATPSLGRAVRQLKVFGGYGKDVGMIASACPNVETLYVHVSVKSGESTVGIKKVLLALSPTRLYLENSRAYHNKKGNELHQLIGTQFSKWTRLVSGMSLLQKFLKIRFRSNVYASAPHSCTALLYPPVGTANPTHQCEVHYSPSYTYMRPVAFDALKTSPRLRDVWIDVDAFEVALGDDKQSVLALLQGPSALQTLHCLGSPVDAEDMRALMETMQCPKAAVDKVVFEEYPEKYACNCSAFVTLVWCRLTPPTGMLFSMIPWTRTEAQAMFGMRAGMGATISLTRKGRRTRSSG